MGPYEERLQLLLRTFSLIGKCFLQASFAVYSKGIPGNLLKPQLETFPEEIFSSAPES